MNAVRMWVLPFRHNWSAGTDEVLQIPGVKWSPPSEARQIVSDWAGSHEEPRRSADRPDANTLGDAPARHWVVADLNFQAGHAGSIPVTRSTHNRPGHTGCAVDLAVRVSHLG